jgi:hypothetical protein
LTLIYQNTSSQVFEFKKVISLQLTGSLKILLFSM